MPPKYQRWKISEILQRCPTPHIARLNICFRGTCGITLKVETCLHVFPERPTSELEEGHTSHCPPVERGEALPAQVVPATKEDPEERRPMNFGLGLGTFSPSETTRLPRWHFHQHIIKQVVDTSVWENTTPHLLPQHPRAKCRQKHIFYLWAKNPKKREFPVIEQFLDNSSIIPIAWQLEQELSFLWQGEQE